MPDEQKQHSTLAQARLALSILSKSQHMNGDHPVVVLGDCLDGLEEQLETLQRRNRIALEHANKGAAWSSSEEPTKEDAARFHGALIFVIANLNGTLDTSNPARES